MILKILQMLIKMKFRVILTLTIIVFISLNCYSQKVYTVNYDYQADIKVFVTNYEYQADLLVYKVKYDYQAKENTGLWFFTDHSYQAKKKIYFTKYDYQADIKICYVSYEYQAKWRNPEKKHLLD